MNIMKMDRIGCIIMDDVVIETVINRMMNTWHNDDMTLTSQSEQMRHTSGYKHNALLSDDNIGREVSNGR